MTNMTDLRIASLRDCFFLKLSA